MTVGFAAAGVVLVGLILVWRRHTRAARRSRRAHEAARRREPPVSPGETYTLGVREFTTHHTGGRVAVGRVEGFVIFVTDVPESVEEGDAIRATVLSFNRGKTSADATFAGRD